MEALFTELEALIPALAAVLVVVVQLLKPFNIPNDFIPHVSIGVGILFGLLMAFGVGGDYFTYGLAGAIAGATASGLYDTGKGTVNAIEEQRGVKK